jgi:hypothetical protein
MWCGKRTDPILSCFNNTKGLNCGDLLVGIVLEFLSWLTILRLGTVVPSQDLSGAWVTVRG